MRTDKVAMIFGHPAHELAVLGMIRRWSPAILYLTRADSAGEQERESQSREVLSRAQPHGQATFMGISEPESYGRILRGDHEWYARVRSRVAEWLAEQSPTAVFFDAFEFYNIHHDLCSAIATVACRDVAPAADLFHLPLACNSSRETASRAYTDYDRAGWNCRYVTLSAKEGEAKRGFLETAAPIGGYEVPVLLRAVHSDRWQLEPYRPAPDGVRFLCPPETFGWPTWEETGRRVVLEGKYAQHIAFADHYVPLVRSLGLG